MIRPIAFLAFASLAMPFSALASGVESKDPMSVAAGHYAADPTHTAVSARIGHMGFSEVTVTFSQITGSLTWNPASPTTSSVDMTIDAATLNSGFPMRDEHLKGAGFFNTAAHPTITFSAKSLDQIDSAHARVNGTLTLLGNAKPVVLDVTFNGVGKGMAGDNRIGFTAHTRIKRSDFGMTAFLPAVADSVEITIDAEFARK